MTIIKRITLVGVLTAITTLATHTAAQVPTGDVIITVSGKVAARCNSYSLDVDLGNLFTYDLQNAGSSSTWVGVPLKLECEITPANVTASFTGISTADGNGNFGIRSDDGDAKGLELQLGDGDENLIPNGGKITFKPNTDVTQLSVRAISPNGNPTAGAIYAFINVTYEYS